MGGFSTIIGVDPRHRKLIPIDHPDLSITTAKIADGAITTAKIADRNVTRAKLEYPTTDVSFAYLGVINKIKMVSYRGAGVGSLAYDTFTDKSVFAGVQVNQRVDVIGRAQDYDDLYVAGYQPPLSTQDHYIDKVSAGIASNLATEAIDIDTKGRGLHLTCSGSTIKSMRYELLSALDPNSLPTPNATISATDTTFASGYFGYLTLFYSSPQGGSNPELVYLKAPASPLPQAQAILEVDIAGSGKPNDPFRANMVRDLREISQLTGLPDFLYREAKKYEILKAKGFTDEEIQLLFGSIPQHQVDLNAVTWGAFEFSEESATNIIVIAGDNPYQQGAILRQIEHAKRKNLRVIKPPKDYSEAIEQYRSLSRDFPHWLAGKENYAYQTLGFEELEAMAVADFYYGELIDHKTHYDQIKQVPDFEIQNTLNMWKERLERVNVLIDEKEKHLNKLKTIEKQGW